MTITNPDWVPPIESTFDTGKAIRSEQGLMLAGNPIAIALGKPGAPRLRGFAAMRPSEYADLFPIVSAAGTTTIPSYTYTGTLQGITTTSTTFVTGCEITITARLSGTCRFTGTAGFSAIGNRFSEVRLLKNGVQIAIASAPSGSGSSASFTVDATVTTGDVFTWEVRELAGAADATLVNPSILGSFDQIVTVGLPIKQSEILP